jgi:hypothetical protein
VVWFTSQNGAAGGGGALIGMSAANATDPIEAIARLSAAPTYLDAR